MYVYQHPQSHPHNNDVSRELLYQSDIDELQRNWKNMQNAYRLRYPNLTDKDVYYSAGEFDDMMQRVASRINRSIYEVEEDICNWLDN